MEIGEVIKLVIKKKGITQRELSVKAGITTTALSQIIKGTYNPTPNTLNKICKELNVPKSILNFLAINENEIPKDKLELYKMLEPSIRHFLIEIFGNNEFI